MEIDFDGSDRVSDFITVPAGTYLCRVAEIRPGTTRAGDERWSLRLVVAEGQHVGKQAAWDSLVFSTRGRARARMVLQALGLPAAGRVQIEPHDLEGRHALVEIRPAEYQSPAGEVVRRNEVPYDGFRAATRATTEAAAASIAASVAMPNVSSSAPAGADAASSGKRSSARPPRVPPEEQSEIPF